MDITSEKEADNAIGNHGSIVGFAITHHTVHKDLWLHTGTLQD